MTQKIIDEETRLYLEVFLPDAISNALESYQDFVTKEKKSDKDAENFSKHHNACKVAIAHVELLLRLAKSVMMHKDNDGQSQEFIEIISRAQKNVLQHKKNEQD